MISCCGVTLPALEAEQADEEHEIKCEKIEDEFFISIQHPMTKEHYISFVVYCTGERFESVKLYPESSRVSSSSGFSRTCRTRSLSRWQGPGSGISL